MRRVAVMRDEQLDKVEFS